jgi:hypothetical protein
MRIEMRGVVRGATAYHAHGGRESGTPEWGVRCGVSCGVPRERAAPRETANLDQGTDAAGRLRIV